MSSHDSGTESSASNFRTKTAGSVSMTKNPTASAFSTSIYGYSLRPHSSQETSCSLKSGRSRREVRHPGSMVTFSEIRGVAYPTLSSSGIREKSDQCVKSKESSLSGPRAYNMTGKPSSCRPKPSKPSKPPPKPPGRPRPPARKEKLPPMPPPNKMGG